MSETDPKPEMAPPSGTNTPSNGSLTPVPGELFAERYRAERLLGRGAMGEVWAMHDQELGESVALKLLTAEVSDSAERFRREVRLARRVTHRNAARTFDLGSIGNRLYLTMELVEGESLAERVARDGQLPVAEVLTLALQIAEGLAAAHAVGVVHRDLKPANVILAEDGRVVLTDFGLARATEAGVDLTRSAGTLLGTPAYMAPEQVRGGEIGPYTDVYAFGSMLYEMLTGRYAYVRDNAIATALARLEGPPEDPRSFAPMPEPLARLILRCLEREPALRPRNAGALAEALITLSGSATTNASAATMAGLSTTSRSFLPSHHAEKSLAVLPFRHRGPADQSYLAETIAEELTDVLTMTRGLQVVASGATARYRDGTADPREAGRELGVDAIVEGTLQVGGKQLRLSTRLIEVASGTQLWVGRFDGKLEDVFELQESMARRIAEALRVELEIFGSRHGVPAEAIDLYLQARQRAEEPDMTGRSLEAAVELLVQAIEIAPEFGPAIASHAEAAVRRWFLPSYQGDAEISEYAHEAVRRALETAPHLAQSHFAAARLAVSDGQFDVAARELSKALKIAPTYADAMVYLGMLQCEAGRSAEGARNLEIGLQLDPSQTQASYSLARNRALDGDYQGARELMDELAQHPQSSRFATEQARQRIAAWFGDLEGVRNARPESLFPLDHVMVPYSQTLRGVLLQEASTADLGQLLETLLESRPGPRLASFFRQIAVEAMALAGDSERALEQLRLADESGVLVDTDWMERCPALDSLRQDPEFRRIEDNVQRRANAIWRAV